MSGLERRGSRITAVALVGVLATVSGVARAEIVLRDVDGWSVYTVGRAEGHYQLIDGDGDPVSHNRLVGGQIENNGSQDQNNHLVDSRVRSGFIATQLGFGVRDHMTDTLEASAFVSIWLNGIAGDRGAPPLNKDVDVRDGWGSLAGPAGTFVFGRAFSIFGSASGVVNNYAWEFGVGHPCLADSATIACGSVGAGPLYAGYNAQLRYITPRFAGFELQASIEDPSALPDFRITPLPRFEGQLDFTAPIRGDGRFVVTGQGLAQRLGKLNLNRDGTDYTTAWGVMGVARLELGAFKLGGGAWTGKGMGTNNALQQDDQAKPLAHDLPGGNFPGDELRMFRGYFGNVVLGWRSTALAVGGGAAFVQETVSDAAAVSTSLLKQNVESHVVVTQRVHAIVFSAEYMHWRSDWYLGEKQALNFIGAGSTFVW
jgi:hypothetical protein